MTPRNRAGMEEKEGFSLKQSRWSWLVHHALAVMQWRINSLSVTEGSDFLHVI